MRAIPELPENMRLEKAEHGYIKLADGSVIVFRVAIVDIIELGGPSPFGKNFDVRTTGGISVRPSEEVVEKVRDKPVVKVGEFIANGWERVEIEDKKNAYEEALYIDADGKRYLIRVEVEPLMVSRNIRYKTERGEPLYAVSWVPKITWKEVKET